MQLKKHHIIAIILALSLFFVVLAFPAQGQTGTDYPYDNNTLPGCTEEWICEPQGDCINGSQHQYCVDMNQCGTDEMRPPERVECHVNDTGTPEECIELWECSEWSECSPEGIQNRTCWDSNGCIQTFAPVEETRECQHSGPPEPCIPEWFCQSWSECESGIRIRDCHDSNQCGILEGMPEETYPCQDYPDPGQNETCLPDWVCTQWSECDGQTRFRRCEDVNECDDSNNEMQEQQPCFIYCQERWECSEWSECDGQTRFRGCEDVNQCSNYPLLEETMHCEMQQPGNQTQTQNQTQNQTQSQTQNQTAGNATTPVHVEPGPEGGLSMVIDEIQPEKPARILIDAPNFSVSKISIQTRNRVTQVKVNFRELESPPVPKPEQPVDKPETRVYKYLDISKENMADQELEKATVEFHVTKQWVRERLINVSTIRLMRHVDNAWTDLDTKLIYTYAGSLYFEAETPGFSIFAIAGEYMIEQSGGGMLCLPLDRRCHGDEVQECDIYGYTWTIIEDCEYGCRTDSCIVRASPESPVNPEDLSIMLIVGLLIIIVVLSLIVTILKIRRRKLSQELGNPSVLPKV